MTQLVTGAAGFLGAHVTDLLVARGARPRVLVAPNDEVRDLPLPDLDVHRADIRDPTALRRALDGVDCVLHCAARTGPWGPEDEYRRTNVDALASLVLLAMELGVRRVVHVSSITVHGNDVGGAGDESSALRAEPNPYSRSKLAGERVLKRLVREEGARVSIVRPGWVYGPRDRASFARLAHSITAGRMAVVGSGTNHLPLIYARDVAHGILLAAERPQAEGRTYILVNDEPVTQLEFLRSIARELGVPPPRGHIPYRMALAVGGTAEQLGRLARRRQPPPLMRYGVQLLGGENRFSIARARAELGFSPQVSMLDGVRRSVRWYRAADGESTAAVAA